MTDIPTYADGMPPRAALFTFFFKLNDVIILTDAELQHRASRIKLVLTDIDGVLTDTGIYYSARGEELRRFSIRDGMGMEILREHGIETAMISREASENVKARSAKLKLKWQFLGLADKLAELPTILATTGLTLDNLAYIGDDVNDFAIMERIANAGLTGCPSDAMPQVKSVAHHKTITTGGNGAFREFADWILALRAKSSTI